MRQAVGAFVVVLAACSSPGNNATQQSDTRQVATAVSTTPKFSPSSPTLVHLSVKTRTIGNTGVHLDGETNLPDGTEVMVSVQRGPVMGGDKETVMGGHFAEDVLPKGGAPIPPGIYEVEVSTPFGDFQPPEVKAQLGSNYEALRGSLLSKSNGGRIVDYNSKFHVGGSMDGKADEQARADALQRAKDFAERSCRSNPDTVERLTGTAMTADARERSITNCLKTMAHDRAKFARSPLPRQ